MLRIALQTFLVSFDGIDFEDEFELITVYRGVFRNLGESLGKIIREKENSYIYWWLYEIAVLFYKTFKESM